MSDLPEIRVADDDPDLDLRGTQIEAPEVTLTAWAIMGGVNVRTARSALPQGKAAGMVEP